jgi:hypothetical protein
VSPTTWASRPSRSWPRRCSNGPWPPACRVSGDWRHRLRRRPTPAHVAGAARHPPRHGGQVHRTGVDADRPWPPGRSLPRT